jgi:hypothetical protein
MKNIKKLVFLFFKIIGVILLILFLIPVLYLIVFDPYFFYIDSCLDLGGSWNEEINDCEGSKSYKEWKERTWY